MVKKELENRDDLYTLVSSFYEKVKKDDFIGPIFLEMIPENEWEKHIQRITDFWESNIFFSRTYKGNPAKVHKKVDAHFKFGITQKHFGKWLELWLSSVDEYFYGDKAFIIKERARNIAFSLFLSIFENRSN